MTNRNCPVAACPNMHTPDKLMCRSHWFSVPRELRDELWQVFREQGPLSNDYLMARERCIAHCEKREPRELEDVFEEVG